MGELKAVQQSKGKGKGEDRGKGKGKGKITNTIKLASQQDMTLGFKNSESKS